MEGIIAAHPEAAITALSAMVALLGFLVTIISSLLILLFKQFVASNNGLAAAIAKVEQSVEKNRLESKEERKGHFSMISDLYERVQGHEAEMRSHKSLCETTRKYCSVAKKSQCENV